MILDFVWGIFVSEGATRFPNFFPIAIYTSKEKAIEELNCLPRTSNYQLLKLPVDRNFAYYHKKSGKLVGMDGIYHEHYHHRDDDEQRDNDAGEIGK